MRTKWLKRSLVILGLIPAVYIGGVLVAGTLWDYTPPETIRLENLNKTAQPGIADDSVFTAAIWNIGYSGLGASSNFFYDRGQSLRSDGYMVHSTSSLCQAYWKGIETEIRNHPVAFWMLQEVDRNSKRSYYQDQYEALQQVLPNHATYEATNYAVPYVPVPILEPWQAYGKTNAGLGTFIQYQAENNMRIQMPGNFDWPERVFLLDRCISYHEIPLAFGKKLVLMNIHNSAYDDGTLKQQQMDLIKTKALEAYEQGHFVLVGGDWNQNPPGFNPAQLVDPNHKVLTQTFIEDDLFPAGWQWVYDPAIPTNRKCQDIYQKGKTNVTIIDFFLLSPNLEVISIKTHDLDFAYSDHQPVYLTFRLGS